MQPDKFWKSLKTSTRNSLARAGIGPDADDFYKRHPWQQSVKDLVRIPGIGPSSIAEIARLTEKHCV